MVPATYLIILATNSLSLPTSAQEFVGKPNITNGDTIRIDQVRIRLHGIDAPEAKQTCKKQNGSTYPCGTMATFELARLIEEHWVTCHQKDVDRYKRIIAICFTGPVNLNAEMVKSGWAIAYRKYSKDYVDEEVEANAAKRGMWQGDFLKPWEWRKGKRLGYQ